MTKSVTPRRDPSAGDDTVGAAGMRPGGEPWKPRASGSMPGRIPAFALTALTLLASSVGAADAPARAGVAERLECQPSLRSFCRNLHVSCSGVTRVPAWPFVVVVNANRVAVEAEAAPEPLRERWRRAKGVRAEHDAALLIRPTGEGEGAAADWLKVFDTGRYVLRVYVDGEGLMSMGRCASIGRPSGTAGG